MWPSARPRRLGPLMAAIFCSLVAGCDRNSTPTTPTAVTAVAQPAPSPPSTPTSVSVSGTVTASSGGPVTGARVEIAAGANSGQAATTDAAGRYALINLSPGAITIRITASAFVTQTVDLVPAASQIADVTLTPVPFQTRVRVFDADTSSALQGITMSGSATSAAPSSMSGVFIAFAANDSAAPRGVVLDGPGVIERRTTVQVPGPELALSMIASNLDLVAFDQMLRAPMLYRWTTAPPLLVERRTLQFAGENAASATATEDAMTDADLASLQLDLQDALAPMTGGAFSGFSDIQQQTTIPGAQVGILNTGVITVTWMAGLAAATGVLGYGRFQIQSDGSVISGSIQMDRDFQRSGSQSVRTLRAHELGHALGYSHVTTRMSVMQPDATVWPTPWDSDAFRIAFARMPGNRSPDVDPNAASASAVAGSARWVGAIR
jgi:Carboxypeptidase regulatory-like domain